MTIRSNNDIFRTKKMITLLDPPSKIKKITNNHRKIMKILSNSHKTSTEFSTKRIIYTSRPPIQNQQTIVIFVISYVFPGCRDFPNIPLHGFSVTWNFLSLIFHIVGWFVELWHLRDPPKTFWIENAQSKMHNWNGVPPLLLAFGWPLESHRDLTGRL